MSEGYVRAIERFASRNQISVVRFQRRESKEEVARPYFEQAEREGRFGVVMIGVAQERARVWAGWRQGGSDGHPHFAFGWQSRVPNHLLLLRPRPRVGPGVRQVLLLCALSALAVPQRPRVGEAAGRAGRDRLPAARQRLSLLRRRRGAGRDLRAALGPRRLELLPPLAANPSLPAERRGSPARLPLPARLPPARAVRHARLRPAPGRPRLVRADAPRPAHARPPRSR